MQRIRQCLFHEVELLHLLSQFRSSSISPVSQTQIVLIHMQKKVQERDIPPRNRLKTHKRLCSIQSQKREREITKKRKVYILKKKHTLKCNTPPLFEISTLKRIN